MKNQRTDFAKVVFVLHKTSKVIPGKISPSRPGILHTLSGIGLISSVAMANCQIDIGATLRTLIVPSHLPTLFI
jgi:hypothetical protein